jgi:hypothetical protein
MCVKYSVKTRIKCSRKVGPGFEYRSLPKGGDSSLNNSVENNDEVLNLHVLHIKHLQCGHKYSIYSMR